LKDPRHGEAGELNARPPECLDNGQPGSYACGLVSINALVSSERSLFTGWPETGFWEVSDPAVPSQRSWVESTKSYLLATGLRRDASLA